MTHEFSHRLLTPLFPARLLLAGLVAPLLLGLSACTEVTQFLTRAETKPASDTKPEAQAAAQPAAEVPDPIPAPQEKPKPGKLYEWSGDGRSVTRIIVNTNEQKARFYAGDEQIGWTTVASGVSKHPTPVGHFEVMEKVENKRSNLYGRIYTKGGKVMRADAKSGRDAVPAGARFEGAKMPYFLRLTYDGIGLHAGPIPRPGRPASHGCIRMPSKMAPILFKHVNVGTKVSIVGKGPDYGNYVQKQRALAAQQAARAREQREIEARRAAAAATAAVTPAGVDAPSTAQGSTRPGPSGMDSSRTNSATRAETGTPARQEVVKDSVAEAPAAARQERVPVTPTPSPATVQPAPAADSGPVQTMSAPAPSPAPVPAAQPTPVTAPVTAPASPAAPPAAAPAAPSVVHPPQAPAYPMPYSTPYAPVMRPASAPMPAAPASPGAAASMPPSKESTDSQSGAPAGAPREG